MGVSENSSLIDIRDPIFPPVNRKIEVSDKEPLETTATYRSYAIYSMEVTMPSMLLLPHQRENRQQ